MRIKKLALIFVLINGYLADASLGFASAEICEFHALAAKLEPITRDIKLSTAKVVKNGEDDFIRLMELNVHEIRQRGNPSEFSHLAAGLIKRMSSPEQLLSLIDLSYDFPLSAVHVRHIQDAIFKRWGRTVRARKKGDGERASEIAIRSKWGKDNDIYYHPSGQPTESTTHLSETLAKYRQYWGPRRAWTEMQFSLDGIVSSEKFMEFSVYVLNHQVLGVIEFDNLQKLSNNFELSPNHQALLRNLVREKSFTFLDIERFDNSFNRAVVRAGIYGGTAYLFASPIIEPIRGIVRRVKIQEINDRGWGKNGLTASRAEEIDAHLETMPSGK